MLPPSDLWAGALSLLLIHGETGCPHSALNAARLLDRLCDQPEVDEATRNLCERASRRLAHGARENAVQHWTGRDCLSGYRATRESRQAEPH